MLKEIVQQLDEWMKGQATEAMAEGRVLPKPCWIHLLGQMSLIETGLPFELLATNDVDVRANYDHQVKKEFERLLAKRALVLDPVGHEAWMPKETIYTTLFEGRYVTLKVADVESVLLSKGLKAPQKNTALLTDYLSVGATARFMQLAEAYELDLEQFV